MVLYARTLIVIGTPGAVRVGAVSSSSSSALKSDGVRKATSSSPPTSVNRSAPTLSAWWFDFRKKNPGGVAALI